MSAARHRLKWTEAEEDFVERYYGLMSLDEMARRLERTTSALKAQVYRMGLGRQCEMNGRCVTISQLGAAFTHRHNATDLAKYLKRRGLRIRKKKVASREYLVVYLDEFWAWYEKHRNAIPASQIRPLALGAEPEWVEEQRARERGHYARRGNHSWTESEEMLLLSMHRQGAGLIEMCDRLGRSDASVRRRLTLLGCPKPMMRGTGEHFTREESETLRRLIRDGATMVELVIKLRRTSDAIRQRMHKQFGCGIVDEVRAMILKEEADDDGAGRGGAEKGARAAV